MRISLFSGPGAGKSVTAASLFAELKKLGYSVEFVQEYIKKWAYEGYVPKSYDQLYVFAKQLRSEDIALQHVEHVVTDSPVLMQVAYASKHNFEGVESLLELTRIFETCRPSLNIFLDRGDIPYQQWGRYQDYEQAKEMDTAIKNVLANEGVEYVTIPSRDLSGILSYIISKIGDP